MSEPKQPPKLLLHKPKKSQRPPSDPSSKGDGTGGARSVSTASSNSTPPLPEAKRSFWYRFRVPIVTLLVMNAVVVGYTMFRTFSKPSEISEEAQSVERTEKKIEEKGPKEETATEGSQDEKNPVVEIATEKENDEKKPIKAEVEKIKAEDVHIKGGEQVHIKGGEQEQHKAPQAISLPEISKQKISNDEQQELYKWLLAEKRKVKPANKAEKAQIDAEKALLKDFLKGKSTLNV